MQQDAWRALDRLATLVENLHALGTYQRSDLKENIETWIGRQFDLKGHKIVYRFDPAFKDRLAIYEINGSTETPTGFYLTYSVSMGGFGFGAYRVLDSAGKQVAELGSSADQREPNFESSMIAALKF